ncbi:MULTISPECIES: methyltransferase [Massilia]|uniref:SAM-dependent methyltransferase n=1 Tax=Massilia aurea TaxID=373040 RepID=A0A422QL09_9BURK|nr:MULTISPECIES: class I SAM-dependent methyltransferase [Massilia]MDY0962005.1 class I SAM-dependent methyltransferase [Massilia sp. CFBP9026]RNF30633.1 SAM-dependent methyltransferase [Massilia aurea]
MNSSNANALLALGTALRQAGYRFMTVTPSTHRRINNRPGNERAHDLRGVFGWSRPFDRALLPASVLALMADAGVLEENEDGLRSLVRVSTLDDMLLFHSAWPTRDDDSVFFGPDTYRFVTAMRRGFAFVGAGPVRAVDIGCGGGAGALTIARAFPHAEVIGADINTRALELAMVNGRLNGVSNLALAESDLFDGLQGDFDLVVSNPPFVVDPDARRYRHGGGEHGAELSRRIVEQSLGRLRRGGSLMLYTGVALSGPGDHFLDSLRPTLAAQCDTWTYTELDPDIFGGQLGEPGYEDVERIAAVWLHAVKR